MCGRVGLGKEERYAIDARYSLNLRKLRTAPQYNVPPSSMLPLLVSHRGKIEAKAARWGLVPGWSNHTAGFSNARGETAPVKPAFRDAFKWRRGVVVVDHFFEWEQLGGRVTQPWLFRRTDGKPLLMAALWEPGPSCPSTAIVTIGANEFMAPIHNRMPVILEEADVDCWMDGGTTVNSAMQLVRPARSETLVKIPVSRRVSTGIDDAAVCDPVTVVEDLRLAL
ncbi:MAG: SOS response-associated peptidase [Phycisphaerae bacterium]|nr:SOS response-associated peptidase [Gemmatimonadaceae bacterium]